MKRPLYGTAPPDLVDFLKAKGATEDSPPTESLLGDDGFTRKLRAKQQATTLPATLPAAAATQPSTTKWRSNPKQAVAGMLDSVHVPTLIIHGRQDPIPLESSESASRALGAVFRVLDSSGHVPYVEQPEPLFLAIEEFLRSSAPSPGRLPSVPR